MMWSIRNFVFFASFVFLSLLLRFVCIDNVESKVSYEMGDIERGLPSGNTTFYLQTYLIFYDVARWKTDSAIISCLSSHFLFNKQKTMCFQLGYSVQRVHKCQISSNRRNGSIDKQIYKRIICIHISELTNYTSFQYLTNSYVITNMSWVHDHLPFFAVLTTTIQCDFITAYEFIRNLFFCDDVTHSPFCLHILPLHFAFIKFATISTVFFAKN